MATAPRGASRGSPIDHLCVIPIAVQKLGNKPATLERVAIIAKEDDSRYIPR